MIKIIKPKCEICKDYEANPFLKSHLATNICEECYDQAKASSQIRKNLWPEIDQITEKLYLGNEDASQDFESLIQRKITHILVVGNMLKQHFPGKFTYKQIKINDFYTESIKQYFQECIEFIQNGTVVFVHCAAGISRSASIVIAYIMQEQKKSLQEAFDFVESKRSKIRPNEGFQSQLKEFEQELQNQYK